jgi:hypothetical protein
MRNRIAYPIWPAAPVTETFTGVLTFHSFLDGDEVLGTSQPSSHCGFHTARARVLSLSGGWVSAGPAVSGTSDPVRDAIAGKTP